MSMRHEANDETKEGTVRQFCDLDAWKRMHAVVLETYRVTHTFPREEQFGITSQMRRAAISAESNIAEGFGRNTAKDKQHFYAIAKGSMLELQSQFMTARDLGFVNEEKYECVVAELLHAIRLTAGLVRSASSR